ncbi:MAG: MarR family transcriptional regulator [Ilumatobacteraceae bacterium]
MAVTRLARLLRQQDNSGFGPTLTSALSTVAKRGPMTLVELAAQERVAPPTITKIVDRMVAAGYVQRTCDPRDRRVSLVASTSSGDHQLQAFRQRRVAWLQDRLRELDPDDLTRLVDALDVLERLTAMPEVDA